jgi:SAM-dependent methyltransferase
MVDEINANFYRAFEDRFRGSRELIKSRLRVYLPFVEPLRSYYDDAMALDLGCGRGEWLELLQEAGFDVQGVDLDNGMLAACRERDLNVQTCDAVDFLKELPDASRVVVTGFHIAEHIPFPDLQVLVKESLRVLKPGGLLILETPNPENIVVGTSYFFIDPTHLRPIPPQLLSFLPEYYGFKRVKILRLQEPAGLHKSKALTLLDVLRGVSPDCAVVAQKKGEAAILRADTINKPQTKLKSKFSPRMLMQSVSNSGSKLPRSAINRYMKFYRAIPGVLPLRCAGHLQHYVDLSRKPLKYISGIIFVGQQVVYKIIPNRQIWHLTQLELLLKINFLSLLFPRSP